MSVKNKPAIEAYIGASGSGKGVSIGQRLRELQPARLIIWDPRNEYSKQARPVSNLAHLVRDVRQAGAGGFRLRFVPGAAMDLADCFGIVCKLAFAAGNLVFVAEELSDVTTASHSPPAWRRINTQGRHAGLHVLGAAQRPALIDKTFLANCTLVRCFQLNFENDIEAMAKQMRVPADLVASLVTADTDTGATIMALEYVGRTRELSAVQIKVSASGVREEKRPYVAGSTQTAGKPRTARRKAT